MDILWQKNDDLVSRVREAFGADALDELLRRAFPRRTVLHVGALTPGISGAAVLHVRPEQDGSAQHPCVVKIGPVGDIHTEYERWQQYVQPYLGHGEMPDVLSTAVIVGNHAALVYKFYAARTLADMIRDLAGADDSIGIVDAVQTLLTIVHVWHRSRSSTYFDLIAEEYPLEAETLERFEQYAAVKRQWGEIAEPKLVRDVWSQPPESLRKPQLTTIGHGDLHADNVLVGPNGSFGIIDFLHTGRHHFLRDLATLEADLVLRVLCPPEATAEQAQRLVALLEPYYTTAAFTTSAQHDALGQGAWLPLQNVVRCLRSAVWGRSEHDAEQIPGYLIAVIRRMVKMVVRGDSRLTDFQRWIAARLVSAQTAELARGGRSAELPMPVSGDQVRERVPGPPAEEPVAAYLDLESEVEVVLGQLSESWRPTAIGAIEAELPAIAEEVRRRLPERERRLAEVFRALTDVYPEPLPDPDTDPEMVNHVLARADTNRMIEARVVRQGEALVIQIPDVAALLSHSTRELQIFEPLLRAACDLYEAGSYQASLTQFRRLAARLSGDLSITRSELTLFFYFLSKCLLKLNMYSSLNRLLDGPYRVFCVDVCPELEAERLLIAGVAHRHRGELSLAQACLDDAVAQLALLASRSESALVHLALADAYVLSAHPRFDNAVAPEAGLVARQATVRLTLSALESARQSYEEYWRSGGRPSHYEGRLAGTMAYMTVVRSVVEPATLDDEAWSRAAADARHGFEPEFDRKPVGVIAGRAALASVKLAQARWLAVLQPDHWPQQMQECLREAEKALSVVLAAYVSRVELGPRFEYRKLMAIQSSIGALTADPLGRVDPDALTPLI
ncbi:phosphotransferase [Micromonospora sp. CA-240977]|uniref:phosphotransferase n=1 Tax=Micromonospora sp. CA-240977 TaxID=3239957 RepID=UPI003D8F23CA